MKNRRALPVIVLLSLFTFGVANAKTDFHGVLYPWLYTTVIDSAYLVVGSDSISYATSGWSAEFMQPDDTFDFPDSLEAWPQRIWLKGTSDGNLVRAVIHVPIGHTWYHITMQLEGSMVMFYGAGEPGVEERGPAVERLPHLAVSPSVVTGQMTVRLRPVGTGRPVVEIHDAVGNVVRSLDCTTGSDGVATATWNCEDEFGRPVPKGVYFCRYAASDVIAVRKVLVTR